jgi:hypothetical protein
MSLSGIAAFIVPQGKVAYWTDWTFMGLSKPQWGNIHITTSVLFLIAGIWHTWYNWTPLMQYLRGIPGRMTASMRDLVVAFLVTLFFTAGAVTKTPPLNYILNFNGWIKDSWVKSAADEPPFGHAELLSLKGFCKKMYIDTGEAIIELSKTGVTVENENLTIEQIAHNNRMTPAKVYQCIKKLERPDATPPSVMKPDTTPTTGQITQPVKPTTKNNGAAVTSNSKEMAEAPRYTGDSVIERFEGKGIGKKTLAGICQELKLDSAKVKQKLEAKNMAIKDDETLKAAATRLDIVPIELLKAILVGEPII